MARNVEHATVTRGFVIATVESSRSKTPHTVGICMTTGAVWCSCEDYFFRYGPHDPKVNDEECHCVHIQAVMAKAAHG